VSDDYANYSLRRLIFSFMEWISMIKQLVTGSVLGLALLSGSVQAIEGSVDVGEH